MFIIILTCPLSIIELGMTCWHMLPQGADTVPVPSPSLTNVVLQTALRAVTLCRSALGQITISL